MKTLKSIGMIVCSSMIMFACTSDRTTTDSDTTIVDTTGLDTLQMDTMQGAKADVDAETENFMKTAAAGGMMEVAAGKIAAEQGSSTAVKDFAALMVKDHTDANNELMALATAKKVMLPAVLPAEEQTHLDEMKKMKGKAFDKHYIDMMVDGHAKTVALFKDGSNAADPDVRAFATKTLSVIEGHYDRVKKIKAGM